MKVAVCIPSKGRAYQLESWLGVMLLQPLPPGVAELIVPIAYEADDGDTKNAAYRLRDLWADSDVTILPLARPSNSTAVIGWNMAYNVAYSAGADWFVLGADDIRWHDDWLKESFRVADGSGAQVIGLNDGHTNLDDYAPHYMAHRDYIENHQAGFFVPPVYQSWWFDRDVCQKAQALDLYAPAWLTWVEHRHPDWKTAPMDDTYQEARPLHEEDRRLYEQRKRAGFPADYAEATV
jgi:hypothetical protein